MHLLLIEDETKVASFISKGLEEEGYTVQVAYNGADGLARLKRETYDIVLLDLMLPEIDGFEVLKTMRSWGNTTPVLILTAKSAKEDIVRGLDTGSDDYLTKPFSFEELLARIRALLRRKSGRDSLIVRYRDMTLDPLNRKLSIGPNDVELTDKEYMIMELLVKNSDRPVSRREVAEFVWQESGDSTNIVDVYINFLRKKIESISRKKYIHTVRGTGYILKEEDEVSN
ncbi:MAG: winged-helix transcriptional response regulator [Deltaproteobacteria bacterium]|nr:winged-helix transcriptional response regulator [Deltaproteobacteria bacterium]